MTIWLPELAQRSGPKYRAIAEAIGEDIAAGRLAERERLPTQRDLAYRLGVSLNTVSRAYADAIERGFLYGEVGRGTFVRTAGPLPADDPVEARLSRTAEGPYDFSLNLPAVGDSATYLSETLRDLADSNALPAFLDYQAEEDLTRHAQAGADWIEHLGLAVSGRDVVLTNGAQHGLLVALLALLRPGDVLLTEAMTYAPIKTMAQHLGLKLYPVAMDAAGLSPAALDEACHATAAKTLYSLPTLHTPTTITMPEERRREITAVARRHDLTIIEDDVFGFLPPERPPPLAAIAPERCLLVVSVSKSLAPGLRIGYLHVPEQLRHAVRAAVKLTCWMPPPLMAEVAARWIGDGTADRLNRHQRTEARARQEIAARILGSHRPQQDPHGFNLWLPLPPHWRADAFRAEAEIQNVKLLTAETFAIGQSEVAPAVRLCLSHEVTRERVTQGLRIVAALLNRSDGSRSLVV